MHSLRDRIESAKNIEEASKIFAELDGYKQASPKTIRKCNIAYYNTIKQFELKLEEQKRINHKEENRKKEK